MTAEGADGRNPGGASAAAELLAFNLLGDWLRDTLDPKLRQL